MICNLFNTCFRDSRTHDFSRDYYSARGSDSGMRQPVRGSNPYFSPPSNKQGFREARPSMMQSRGSVMSVKSRYDGVNDSIYRPNNL